MVDLKLSLHAVLLLACVLIGNSTSSSQWGRICGLSTDQQSVHLASDGEGGALVVWQNFWTNNLEKSYTISFDHLLANGSTKYGPNGKKVSDLPGLHVYPKVVSDGDGGSYLIWREYNQPYGIWIQRIDRNGTRLFGNGYQLTALGPCDATSRTEEKLKNFDVVSDGSGGVVVAWVECRGGFAVRLRVSQVISNQDAFPQRGRVDFSYDPNINIQRPRIIRVGGGYVVAFEQDPNNPRIMVLRILDDGSRPWGNTPKMVTSASGRQKQTKPNLVATDDQHLIVAWYEGQIYMERLNVNGPKYLWGGSNNQQNPGPGKGTGSTAYSGRGPVNVHHDGSGGVIYAWQGYHNGSAGNIAVQRLDRDRGEGMWTGGGVVLASPSRFTSLANVPDGNGGTIVVYEDAGNPDPHDLYAQHIDGNGKFKNCSFASPIAVSTLKGDQRLGDVVADGKGDATVVIIDGRKLIASDKDLYAQRVLNTHSQVKIVESGNQSGWPFFIIPERDVGDTRNLLLNQFTLELWMRANLPSGIRGDRVLVQFESVDGSNRPTSAAQLVLYTPGSAGNLSTLNLILRHGDQTLQDILYDSYVGDIQLPYDDGTWHHIAVSVNLTDKNNPAVWMLFDGKILRPERNGSDQIPARQAIRFDLPGTIGNHVMHRTRLGDIVPSGLYTFPGIIAEVRIWETALSEGELRQYGLTSASNLSTNVKNGRLLHAWPLIDYTSNMLCPYLEASHGMGRKLSLGRPINGNYVPLLVDPPFRR